VESREEENEEIWRVREEKENERKEMDKYGNDQVWRVESKEKEMAKYGATKCGENWHILGI
jgi:hypothetical protein